MSDSRMTPQQALRNLEAMFKATGATGVVLDEAEACFEVLWETVLLPNRGMQVGIGNIQHNIF